MYSIQEGFATGGVAKPVDSTQFPSKPDHGILMVEIGENGLIYIDLLGPFPYINISMRYCESPLHIPVVNGAAVMAGRDLNLVLSPGNC
jgi:hypothetical protein